ncbi:MAG: tetratricopeptide repeat protein [Chitinophagales bacterium]
MKVLRYVVTLLLSLMAIGLFAQGNDTVPYKIGHYDIKKQEKVSVVAAKLGVDPQIIVRLNKLRNVQQDLVPGQRVKIPVYPKGYKYTPETVVVHKAPELDSAAIKLLYGEEAKKTEPVVLPPLTPDEAKGRLEMVDVMLEMNEAMLQGVKASIDTLNLPESDKPVDEKNIQALLLKMKRSRDKVLLMPYLEHIHDSLGQEMVLLKNEKTILQKILQPSAAVGPTDTVLAIIDTAAMQANVEPVVNETEQKDTADLLALKEDDVVKDDNRRIEVKRNEQKKKKFKEYYPLDTVIIYDMGPTVSARNYNKNPDIQEKRKGLWDTARAVDPVIDSATLKRLQTPIQMPVDSNTAMKIKIPNTLDSVVIKPIKVQKQVEAKDTAKAPPIVAVAPTDTMHSKAIDTLTVAHVDTNAAPVIDTVKHTEAKVEHVKVDTVSATTAKVDTVAKASVVKKSAPSVADMAMASADSVKRIKAEFFYKRAQRAMGEKNFRNAEQYLKKAVELYPRHFDAWFAMAEMDDLFGSQGTALKEYRVCESIDSTQPKLYYNIGNIYQKMKRKTDAYKAFDRAITLNPEFVLALMARASILSDWKNYDAAIYDYDRVIQNNRTYHFAYKARGQVKLLNRDFNSAADDFTRYLIFEETDPSAYYYRGLAKIGMNDLLEGCLDLSKAADMGYVAAQKAIKKTCE